MIPNLEPGEVHTWSVRLDVPPEVIEDLGAMLSPDERNRSERLRFDRDRERFVAAHGILRVLLGRYVGARPADLGFDRNEFGKPKLVSEFGNRLRFNLSHSADLVLVAVAADFEVGVDVELVSPGEDYFEIAQRFFARDELEFLTREPDSLDAGSFLGIWTQKEAYLKARGEGFEIPPASFSVLDLGGAWTLHAFQPASGYVGALAFEGKDRRIVHHSWHAIGGMGSAAGEPAALPGMP
jgi:4'-phosphopantetheinyl transferase